jgi:hypothetical protein
MKARGWRRVGIVLSVIWFLGFGIYLWGADEQSKVQQLKLVMDDCDMTFRIAEQGLDEEHGLKPQEYMAKWRPINEKRTKCYADAMLETESRSPRSTRFAVVLAIDLVMIVIGWLIVWGCVAVGRWIHRGFTTP